MKRPETATIGWGLLLTGVALWDTCASQTLSSGYDRYLEHPIKKLAAIGAVAVVGAHLLNVFEHFDAVGADPIDRIGRVAGWAGRVANEVWEAIDDQPQI